MRVMIDKFFLAELQERGYVFDYKKLTEIYRASRKKKREIEEALGSKDEAIRIPAQEKYQEILQTLVSGQRLMQSIEKDKKEEPKKSTRRRKKRKSEATKRREEKMAQFQKEYREKFGRNRLKSTSE